MSKIIIIVAIVLAVCGGVWFFFLRNGERIDGSDGHGAPELVYSAPREPDTLIPFLADTEEAIYLSELIYDGLVNRTLINRQGEALHGMALCKRYKEQSREIRNEITLELDSGATWHNGMPFTADDVLFTWEALHASESSLVGWLDSLVERIYKVDEHELHVTLKVERSAEALNEIFSTFKVIPRVYDPKDEESRLPADLRLASGVVNDFNYRPVGTGPFKVASREGNRIHLQRNENYFLGPPRVQRLRMQRIQAPELAVDALIDGSVHLTFNVQPAFFDRLGEADVRSLDYTPYAFYAIAYNLRRPPFDSVNFRRAANLATEKSLLFSLFTGLREADEHLSTSVYPRNYEFVRKQPEAFSGRNGYSVAAAKRQLAGRSGAGRRFALTFSTELQGAGARKMAQAYAELMQEVEVEVELQDLNMVAFDKAVRERSFQAIFLQFGGLNHLYDLRGLFGDDNLFGLRDAQLRRLLDAYGKTLSRIDLERLSKQIHDRVEALAPACFLFTPPRRAFMANNLSKVSIHPEVGFATIESWQFE